MKSPMHRSLLAAVVLGVVGVLGACSVLLDFRQCVVSGDCGEQEWCSADGLCRTLLTEHCTEILGNYTSDGILLGGILSLSGRSQESGDDARSAILLAVDEINDNGGVGGNQGGRTLSV
ncbi:MAG: hypothetical protein CL928_04390, partial [Deltaproteobacteria bacterium]|nr:hypothetical protein [Deltaproteobacteria bacterium]